MLSEGAVEEKNGNFTRKEMDTGTAKNITIRFKHP
jgi:hypothetical protein